MYQWTVDSEDCGLSLPYQLSGSDSGPRVAWGSVNFVGL